MLVYDGSWVSSLASIPGWWLCFPACCGCEKSNESVQQKECLSMMGAGCTAWPAELAGDCDSLPAVAVGRARVCNRNECWSVVGVGSTAGPASQVGGCVSLPAVAVRRAMRVCNGKDAGQWWELGAQLGQQSWLVAVFPCLLWL